LAVHRLGIELHLVAGLDGLEHGRILCLVDHGHPLIHSELLDRSMLDGDLPGRLIDVRDLAVDQG
jgi:hypothetical protein